MSEKVLKALLGMLSDINTTEFRSEFKWLHVQSVVGGFISSEPSDFTDSIYIIQM